MSGYKARRAKQQRRASVIRKLRAWEAERRAEIGPASWGTQHVFLIGRDQHGRLLGEAVAWPVAPITPDPLIVCRVSL